MNFWNKKNMVLFVGAYLLSTGAWGMGSVELDELSIEASGLVFAATRGKVDVVKFEMERISNKNILDKYLSCVYGKVPRTILLDTIVSAARHDLGKNSFNEDNYFKIIELLIKAGADVNVKFNENNLLHVYINEGGVDLRVVYLLIESGIGVNSIGDSLKTPLHFAARKNRFEVVRCLCEQGANVLMRNSDGLTPLEVYYVCYGYENERIAEVLKK